MATSAYPWRVQGNQASLLLRCPGFGRRQRWYSRTRLDRPALARRPAQGGHDAGSSGGEGHQRPDRGAVGGPHSLWTGRSMAASGRHLPGRRGHARAGRPVGPFGVCVVLQRLRAGDRGGRGSYGRGPGPRRGPGQPRPAGSQGAVRLAGQSRRRPADPPAGPRRRRAGRDRLGHRDGPRRPAQPPATGHCRPGLDRVLHLRAAVLRGVLHPWGDRQGRAGHPAHGRQHPVVHRHRGPGAEGDLRHRRPAGQLHRRGPRRHDPPLGPQRGRDPDGAVDADP
jgi:hypothetical protein